MKYYRFPETKLTKVLGYVLMLVLLVFARDTLISNSLLGLQKTQLIEFALVGLVGLVFLIAKRREWKNIFTDRRMLLFALSALVVLLPMVVKRDWQLMYFSMLICVFFGILLTYFTTLKEVAQCYVKVLAALAVYSLLTAYVLRIPADMGLLPVPTFINGAGFEFYHFGLSTVPLDYVPHRNFGMFREPGVYQYFLILGLLLNNYEVQWDKSWKLWTVNGILAVTMVSTFATGGLAELALLAVVLFFDKGYHRTRAGRVAAACAILGGITLIAVSMATQSLLYEGIMENVRKIFTENDSNSERVGAVSHNLGLVASHPLFGATVVQTLNEIRNNTSSSTILFAMLGTLGGVFHMVSWAMLVWDKNRKVITWLLLGVMMAMSFNTQNLIAELFFWLFPMMAMAEKCLPALNRRKKV